MVKKPTWIKGLRPIPEAPRYCRAGIEKPTWIEGRRILVWIKECRAIIRKKTDLNRRLRLPRRGGATGMYGIGKTDLNRRDYDPGDLRVYPLAGNNLLKKPTWIEGITTMVTNGKSSIWHWKTDLNRRLRPIPIKWSNDRSIEKTRPWIERDYDNNGAAF